MSFEERFARQVCLAQEKLGNIGEVEDVYVRRWLRENGVLWA